MKKILGDDFKIDEEEWIKPEYKAPSEDPDATNSFEQLAAENGFSTQSYEVTTKDFYVLKMFRIAKKGVAPTKPPVMVQHGLFSDATTWVVNEEQSPAFQLAALGYDVWLGNNRGNIYSRKNTAVNPDKDPSKFFDYSFYNLGQYDVPAQVDFVRESTGYDKISYIGHSQGTS